MFCGGLSENTPQPGNIRVLYGDHVEGYIGVVQGISGSHRDSVDFPAPLWLKPSNLTLLTAWTFTDLGRALRTGNLPFRDQGWDPSRDTMLQMSVGLGFPNYQCD